MSAPSSAPAGPAPSGCLAPLVPGPSFDGVPPAKLAQALAVSCNHQLSMLFYVVLAICLFVALVPALLRQARGFVLSSGNDAPPFPEKRAVATEAYPWASKRVIPRPAAWKVMRARWRGFDNRVLTVTLPLVQLTIAQLSVLVIYLALVIFIAAFEAGPFESAAFRMGVVAMTQVPPVFLLAMKNTPLSILGYGYERLNFIHRFAGRIFVLFGVIHGAMFYSIQVSDTGGITIKGHYLTGTVMLAALGVIFLSSLRAVRQRLYQTFLVLHIAGYITILVALWYHVEVARPYLYFAFAALALDLVLKAAKTRVRTATLTTCPGGLTRIEVEGIRDGWTAGQHVWIRTLAGGPMVAQKHPFTVATAPQRMFARAGDMQLTIYARSVGMFTRHLKKVGRTARHGRIHDIEKLSPVQGQRQVKVSVEGPYGRTGSVRFPNFPTVLLVSGGSGMTFCMAALEEVIGARLAGTGRTNRVVVIWTVRELGMLDAFSETISRALKSSRFTDMDVSFRLHVTSGDLHDSGDRPVPEGVHVVPARPQLANTLTALVDATLDERMDGIGVGVCGPLELVKACRKAAGQVDAGSVGGIVLHSEMFGW